MGNRCTNREESKKFGDTFEYEILWSSLALDLLIGFLAVYTSSVVYCKRKADQRPPFVVWQLYLLHITWISFAVYFSLLLIQGHSNAHNDIV